MYPRVEIDLKKLKENTSFLVKLCKENGVSVMGVTKCFCALYDLAKAMVDSGVEYIADSRIENLIKVKDLNVKKVLLRIPMQSEVEQVVTYADYSQNSELETLKLLGLEAIKQGKIHKVILMVDLGDLREGIWPTDVDSFVKEAVKIEGIKIVGFGVNLTCYGGVIPDEENLGKLVEIAKNMQDKYNLELEIISGGNSSSLYLLLQGRLPKGINNLRFGEALLLGRETAFGNFVEGLHRDVFTLKAEIIELKDKPSVPIGNIGMDAFGQKPYFEDKGIMKRAIVAIGRQDIDPNTLIPIDKDITVLGASSDHTILDVTQSKRNYKVGDTIEFFMEYGSLLKSMTSEYVKKVIK
ncbi:Predicted amino acid racemase [Caloramator fervidus]|uniref:Predicted amino acid racemase n=1 Tax=Caloramator fervidus TaxID=29344 RepID=A0A1H5VX93_9CLOT|nr:ornithine racemase Orr [Caloramator fervidus]SEF91874.1 Predicted amino acid racemase [Caloramator fervidus]